MNIIYTVYRVWKNNGVMLLTLRQITKHVQSIFLSGTSKGNYSKYFSAITESHFTHDEKKAVSGLVLNFLKWDLYPQTSESWLVVMQHAESLLQAFSLSESFCTLTLEVITVLQSNC